MTASPARADSRNDLRGGERLSLRVHSVSTVADGIISVELRHPDGAGLPPWTPGAHIDVNLPSGATRSYSLHGDPTQAEAFHVAVLRVPGGRGGSVELHEVAVAGAALTVSPPRNAFELRPAAQYLFLAGGIGITPLLAMARAVAGRGDPWAMVYGGRTLTGMAFLEELAALPGGTLSVIPQDEAGLPDFAPALSALSSGAAVFCCGPPAMMTAATETAARTRPDLPLYLERFSGDPATGPVPAGDSDFQVECARAGIVVNVPAGVSILQAVRERIPNVMSNCEQGICSACETAVLDGLPDHRDSVLTPAERAANDFMMICVSRARSPRLILDL